MSNERKVKRWITVNGKHVPIYEDTKDWMSPDMKARYTMFLDRHELYDRLDSDEKTWVEALRAERIEEAEQKKQADIQRNQVEADRLNGKETEKKVESTVLKPWSKAESKRTDDMSAYVHKMINTGGFYEFYEENPIETLDDYTYIMKLPGMGDNEITLTKMNLIYAQNWDENDNRVKRGKAVTGSTYYTVQDQDGAIREDKFAYKTKEDAIHDMKLYIKEIEDWHRKAYPNEYK